MTSTPMILSPTKLRSFEVRDRSLITAHVARRMFSNVILAALSIEYVLRRATEGARSIGARALFFNPFTACLDLFTERHTRLPEAVEAAGPRLARRPRGRIATMRLLPH
jgi:hypothetical protein